MDHLRWKCGHTIWIWMILTWTHCNEETFYAGTRAKQLTWAELKDVEAVKLLTVFAPLHITFLSSCNSGLSRCNENNTVPISASCTGLILTHTGCYFVVQNNSGIHEQYFSLDKRDRETWDWLAEASNFTCYHVSVAVPALPLCLWLLQASIGLSVYVHGLLRVKEITLPALISYFFSTFSVHLSQHFGSLILSCLCVCGQKINGTITPNEKLQGIV